MQKCFLTQPADHLIPIQPLLKSHLPAWLAKQDPYLRQWVEASRFNAEPGASLWAPDSQGKLAKVLIGLAAADDFWAFGDLAAKLPGGGYQIQADSSLWPDAGYWQRAVIAWGLGSYTFNRYQQKTRKPEAPKPQLLIPAAANPEFCQEITACLYWVRDLVNTPTEDMSPEILAKAAVELAKLHGSQAQVITGEALLSANYPTIYAVGRGSSRPPCLVDFRWGKPQAPKLTLVGKGICFDSGGMNLKSGDGMRYMKKDMAGAAHMLALARLIMSQQLPVQLRVLLPMAENMVAGNSYRPGDIITTRSGLTVEVTNTDAEGRLVLCDALTAAVEDTPDLIIDFATLTGAARVAVGPDVAAFFANQDSLAAGFTQAGERTRDPLWRLPLYQPYERYLKSEVADICNASSGPYAGAITAALYLKQFVPPTIPWAHFDISAWNFDKLPGRPVGAEANALRAVYAYLEERYRK